MGTWHCVRRWYISETQSPLTPRVERALKGYTWGTDGQAGDGVEYSSKGFVMGSLGPCWIVNAHSGQFWYQNSTSTGSIGEQRKIFAYEGVTWPIQTYISAKKKQVNGKKELNVLSCFKYLIQKNICQATNKMMGMLSKALTCVSGNESVCQLEQMKCCWSQFSINLPSDPPSSFDKPSHIYKRGKQGHLWFINTN